MQVLVRAHLSLRSLMNFDMLESKMLINSGFTRKREEVSGEHDRLPPGQYITDDFPVLSLGPTPEISTDDWSLKISGLADSKEYTWEDLIDLTSTELNADIHCVTKWSKFDTNWKGIWLDTIIEDVNIDSVVTHVMAHSYDGYTTNLPLDEIVDQKCLIAYEYAGEEIEPEHGGPVRLVIPHLYFWKSAKWLSGLEFMDHDESGFWEERGYHNHGDPWSEERYSDF